MIKDKNKRLGAGNLGAVQVLAHPWFAGIDVEALVNYKITPPFMP